MRPQYSLLASLLVTSVAAGVIDPAVQRDLQPADSDLDAPIQDFEFDDLEVRDDGLDDLDDWTEEERDLWKRRGGGGKPPSSGGTTTTTSGGSNSRPQGTSNRPQNAGGSGGNSAQTRPTTNTYTTSNAGGYSNGGSGPQPRFVGGQYYGGGAKVPYAAGAPRGGITPYATSGRGVFYPGPWLPYPVYIYPYGSTYAYHNRSSNKDEERPVLCACQEYNVCSCEEIKDKDQFDKMFKEIMEDGDYNKMNKTLVTVGEVNGTKTIMVNGTLPNGTTINSSNPDDYEDFLDNAAIRLGKSLGAWPLAVAVGATLFLI